MMRVLAALFVLLTLLFSLTLLMRVLAALH